MGGDTVVNPSTMQLGEFTANLPELLKTYANNIAPFQQQMLEQKQVMAPQELAFEKGILDYFGPEFARQSLGLAQMADPEFYGIRNQAAGKMGELIGGLSPNEMSGSEMEQITRGLNRLSSAQGTGRIPSSTAAISNALTFGDRLMQKKKDVAGVMSTVPPFLTSSRSGLDVYQQVTGRPSYTANMGSNYGAVPLSLGQQYLTESGQNARGYMQSKLQARDPLDRFNETFGSITSGLGNLAGIAGAF